MSSTSALHLGIGLTTSPDEKRLESAEIARKIAEWEATGKKIQVLKRGETGMPLHGKNRGAMTIAERARQSKKRQTEGPMSVEPTTTS